MNNNTLCLTYTIKAYRLDTNVRLLRTFIDTKTYQAGGERFTPDPNVPSNRLFYRTQVVLLFPNAGEKHTLVCPPAGIPPKAFVQALSFTAVAPELQHQQSAGF